MKIQSLLGPPASIIPGSGGGRIMVYEHCSKGILVTPNKTKVTYSPRREMSGNREGLTWHGGVNTATNDPACTIYQKEVSFLKIFLNGNGTCVRYEQDLPREVLETYHERFKHLQAEVR